MIADILKFIDSALIILLLSFLVSIGWHLGRKVIKKILE